MRGYKSEDKAEGNRDDHTVPQDYLRHTTATPHKKVSTEYGRIEDKKYDSYLNNPNHDWGE